MRFGGILTAAAIVAATATPALAQGNGGGNGSQSGSHYNLNIIGVEKGKSGSLAGTNRHTIFVWLGRDATVSSKIYLVPGDEFKVCDGNATDAFTYGCDGNQITKPSGGAVFQLPCNTNITAGTDPDGEPSTLAPCEAEDPQLAYNVYARGLGGPGQATMKTCAYEVNDTDGDGTDLECSTENVVMVRNPSTEGGRETFANVTQALTSLNYCYDTNTDPLIEDIDCTRYALFRDEFNDWFWDYANNGLRLAQLRFYPVQ